MQISWSSFSVVCDRKLEISFGSWFWRLLVQGSDASLYSGYGEGPRLLKLMSKHRGQRWPHV